MRKISLLVSGRAEMKDDFITYVPKVKKRKAYKECYHIAI